MCVPSHDCGRKYSEHLWHIIDTFGIIGVFTVPDKKRQVRLLVGCNVAAYAVNAIVSCFGK